MLSAQTNCLRKHWPIFFLLLAIATFFLPVIFSNKIPIPADTITGLYHPLRDSVADQYPNGTPYKNFLITDSVRQQYPWRQFSISQLKQGHLPWWNPYNFSGTPHIANFQSATFYPLNFIFWLTSFTTGWTILVVLQPVLGSIFLYLYLKNLKLDSLAALFGSITWVFSGFFVAWLEWNTAVHVAVWSPLILLSFDRILLSSPKIKNTGLGLKPWHAILLFSLVAQATAGYPQPWIYLSLLQGVYLLWRIRQKSNVKEFVKIGIVYLLFLFIISPQLISTYQFSELSNRSFDQGNLLEKPDWFLPYQNLIQLIAPDFFGNPATLNYWGVFNYTEFVGYIGIIPALFVIALWLSRKNTKETIFFTFFTIVSLIMATRNPLSVFQFKSNLPFISSSQPSRWLVITNLSLSILAAHSLHQQLKQKTKHFYVLIAALILALIIGSGWFIVLNPDVFNIAQLGPKLDITRRNLILPTSELVVSVAIIITWFVFCQSKLSLMLSRVIPKFLRQKRNFALLLIIITTVTGIRFARKFNSFSDPAFLYPPTKILTYLQQNAGFYRYMTTDRRIMAPNFNLSYGIYSIEGYDPLYLNDYGRLVYATEQTSFPKTSKPFNRIVASDHYSSPIIDLLGVKYILSLNPLEAEQLELILIEGKTHLYQNPHVLPRAFVTFEEDPYQLVDYQPADITLYKPNKIIIQSDVAKAGRLILTDNYYPGWQATLDGQPVEIINWFGLRATIVPEGNHEIIYQYRYPQL